MPPPRATRTRWTSAPLWYATNRNLKGSLLTGTPPGIPADWISSLLTTSSPLLAERPWFCPMASRQPQSPNSFRTGVRTRTGGLFTSSVKLVFNLLNRIDSFHHLATATSRHTAGLLKYLSGCSTAERLR